MSRTGQQFQDERMIGCVILSTKCSMVFCMFCVPVLAMSPGVVTLP